jgi:predicted enzyme related to lactoylglutathione lyase
VWVDSADAAAERAAELGAHVHAPPFDVLEAGRMAVIQDPQGAYVMVWEAGTNRGAQLVNAPGALSWNELASPDLDASSEFYSGLFGWDIVPLPDSPQRYLTIKVGDANNGGIRELAPPGSPPHWLPYFAIDEIDSGVAKVEELRGAKLVGPIDIGIAKIAVVQDPQGAYFALYAGQLEP